MCSWRYAGAIARMRHALTRAPGARPMIRLAERTYPEAARLARDPRSVVILRLGAEAQAEAVAPHLERAGYRVILAPALPYGASPLAAAWAGTVSLSAATL